jgi:hypothetical protein
MNCMTVLPLTVTGKNLQASRHSLLSALILNLPKRTEKARKLAFWEQI